MSELRRSEDYWGRFADGYDEGVDFIVGNAIQKELLKLMSEEHELGNVIEFGCGTGYFTRVIAKNAKHVIATDISDDMLEKARTQLKDLKNITLRKIDCENTKIHPNKFDTVFMANVIHFIKDPNKALLVSHGILNTGGLLLLVDYTGYGMKLSDKMKLGMRFFRVCGMPPRHFKTNLSPDDLCTIVKNAGFMIEDIQLIGNRTKALYLKGRKK